MKSHEFRCAKCREVKRDTALSHLVVSQPVCKNCVAAILSQGLADCAPVEPVVKRGGGLYHSG